MKITLKSNETKVIEYKCRRLKGKVEIRYIDEETGEIIKQENLELPIGEHNIEPNELEGYEVLDEIENDEYEDLKVDTIPTQDVSLKSMRDFRDFIEGSDF